VGERATSGRTWLYDRHTLEGERGKKKFIGPSIIGKEGTKRNVMRTDTEDRSLSCRVNSYYSATLEMVGQKVEVQDTDIS